MALTNLLASIFLFFLCLQPNLIISDITTDRAALLRFHSAVAGNTLQWNHSDPSPCNWTGVTCDIVTNRVTELHLPGHRLAGVIPVNTIGNLTALRILSLRNNRLSGSVPVDIGSCSDLRHLILQNNMFSGELPASLFRLSNLTILDISSNQFAGKLPDLNNSFVEFNVSVNRLNGVIPGRLSRFPVSSFTGNTLCGSPLSSCSDESESKRNRLSAQVIVAIAIGSVLGSVLIVTIIFVMCRAYLNCANSMQAVEHAPTPMSASPVKPPVFSFQRHVPIMVRNSMQVVQPLAIPISDSPVKPPEISFRRPDGMMASENTGSGHTDGEDELTFFGDGGFVLDDLLNAWVQVIDEGNVGTTYKAYLDSGGELIVNRLRNVCVSKMDFTRRIGKFGELKHKNLLPIKAYYYGQKEHLLVFDFIQIRSLSSILHGSMEERSQLTWDIRSKIVFEVACGLEHLHSNNLFHGNIKSNNILLSLEYQVYLSEPGLIQLVSPSNPNLSGYSAPELIDTRLTYKAADVYSFGVLILELITGKDPSVLLNEEGASLPTWVQSVDESRWKNDIFDTNLVKTNDNSKKIVRLLHLGIRCASQFRRTRPSMTEVAKEIKKVCKF